MKKTVNKLLVCLLAGMMCIGSAACGGGGTTSGTQNSGSDVNEPIAGVTNPYKMSVFSFSGGYGEEWLNALAAR
jgi:ABC-type glycerol-3-phosphate transport system substrate-binding protein